jgi:hypothetical protein
MMRKEYTMVLRIRIVVKLKNIVNV